MPIEQLIPWNFNNRYRFRPTINPREKLSIEKHFVSRVMMMAKNHHINEHASCREFAGGIFEIFMSNCCPECRTSISPSLSLLSCFDKCGGLDPIELKVEVNVEAILDIQSLAELPDLRMNGVKNEDDSCKKQELKGFCPHR